MITCLARWHAPSIIMELTESLLNLTVTSTQKKSSTELKGQMWISKKTLTGQDPTRWHTHRMGKGVQDVQTKPTDNDPNQLEWRSFHRIP